MKVTRWSIRVYTHINKLLYVTVCNINRLLLTDGGAVMGEFEVLHFVCDRMKAKLNKSDLSVKHLFLYQQCL